MRDWTGMSRPDFDSSAEPVQGSLFAEPDRAGTTELPFDDGLDRESSASRQHYIDTGRYLRHGEAWTVG